MNNEISNVTLDNTTYQFRDDKARNELSNLYVDTVGELKGITTLVAGDVVKTLGYYEVNDGGSGLYKIRTKLENDVEDGGSIHFLENELVGELIIGDSINVRQFGAYGDDTHDDTQPLQKAIDYSYNKNIRSVSVPFGNYIITKPLFLYENCKIYGEKCHETFIKKINNDKSGVEGYDYDAIFIFANKDLVPEKDTRGQYLFDISLVGNQSNKIEGKTESNMQYGIISPTGCPKILIERFKISNVDVGIQAQTMWMAAIRDSEWLHAHYRGIYVKSKTQGLKLDKLNIDGSTVAGIELNGGVYTTLSNILVEYIYGGVAYKFSGWGGHLINCGYELGWGPEKGIVANNSHIIWSGGYFYGTTAKEDGTPLYNNDATMIDLQNSTFEIDTTNFGYDLDGREYQGKFARIFNSHLKVDDSNVFNCTFKNEIVSTGDFAFLTINKRTIDTRMGNVSILSDVFRANENYDNVDSDVNPTPKYKRKNIFMDNINTPLKNSKGDYNWGDAYNKGDVGFINNPLVSGRAMWINNRDNFKDTPSTQGTITNIANDSITLSNIKLENYDTTGVRLYKNASIIGVNSGATAFINSVDFVNNKIYVGSKNGEFELDEKVKLQPNRYAKDGDFLYVQIIHSGTSSERPSTALTPGQMFFDVSLNKPIWYTGSKWVDCNGTDV